MSAKWKQLQSAHVVCNRNGRVRNGARVAPTAAARFLKKEAKATPQLAPLPTTAGGRARVVSYARLRRTVQLYTRLPSFFSLSVVSR